MQTTVATLLFVTSAVILACIVVDYAIIVFEQTLETEDIPQIERIRNIENKLLNQTDALFNQTETELTDFAYP